MIYVFWIGVLFQVFFFQCSTFHSFNRRAFKEWKFLGLMKGTIENCSIKAKLKRF